MNEWLTNLLVAVILLCVWILAVLYYLSKMDRNVAAQNFCQTYAR